MHKKDEKTARCTTFFSKKNRKTMTVYSDLARKAADAFEQNISIQGYVANLDILDPQRTVEPKDIPQRYFDHAWSSDFCARSQNSTTSSPRNPSWSRRRRLH